MGNHDQPQALGKANAVDIFDTLAIHNTIVADKPKIYPISTAAGPIQVVALPWLRRSAFLVREEAKDLSFEELDARLRYKLTEILQALVARLDPRIPAVLAAHVWVDVAKPSGSERMLSLGGEPQLLLSTLANPAFSYVALGHIHRHQVLSHLPLVAYAGSLERLDFREEKEDKGFIVVELEGKEIKSWEFHLVNARRFVTIDIKLTTQDTDPAASVLQAIARRQEEIQGAIVRVSVTLPGELEGLVRESDIRRALEGAGYIAGISKEVKREARIRLGSSETGQVEKMSPLKALEAYLKYRKIEAQRIQALLEYGQRLLQGEEES